MLTWQKTELLISLIAFFSFTQHYNLNYLNNFANEDDVVLLCGKKIFLLILRLMLLTAEKDKTVLN